jgi:hypothetical protein
LTKSLKVLSSKVFRFIQQALINWSSSDAKISEFFTVGEVANWWTKKSPLELLIRVVDGFCGNRFNRGIVLGMGCGV